MDNERVEKAKKGAKKGILSVVFSRTALIILLLLLQIGLLFSVTFLTSGHSSFFYVIATALGVIVVIYIYNQNGNPAFTMTWVLLIMIFPVFGTVFYRRRKLYVG